MDYVVGFMFSQYGDQVLLIRKQKPEWQRGRLNGIGGKIEPGEKAIDAMVREFLEETGVATEPSEWKEVVYLNDTNFKLHVFMARNDFAYENARTVEQTGEVIVHKLYPLTLKEWDQCITNIKWILPFIHQYQIAFPENITNLPIEIKLQSDNI